MIINKDIFNHEGHIICVDNLLSYNLQYSEQIWWIKQVISKCVNNFQQAYVDKTLSVLRTIYTDEGRKKIFRGFQTQF